MPNTRPLKININGTDRTTSILHDSIQLEESLQDGTTTTTTSARFRVLDGGGFSMDTMQVVQFVHPTDANEKYFEGYITGLVESEFRSGVVLDYDIVCSDYSHDTGHGEALVDSTYTSTSDSTVIQTELAIATPNLNVTNFVDTLDSSIENLDFSNLTAREMLHQLAKLVGATWYVDPDKNLHWYDGENLAPMVLTDAPSASEATIDPEVQGWGAPRWGVSQWGGQSTRLVGYRQLHMQKNAPEATQAKVIGGGSTTATVSGDQVGGRHMLTKVEDPQITNATQATQLGVQVLEDTSDSPTYTLTIDEPGARAGQKVRLINALRSIDDYFMINRIVTTWHPSGHIVAQLEIGKHKQTFVEQLSDLAKAVSGGSKGGASTGRPEGTAGRNHGHTGGADSPKIGEDGFDTDVKYWGTVSDGTNTADADSAGDTLTFTESTAIDIVVSEDDTVTVGMDAKIRAKGSAAATGSPADDTAVEWGSGDVPEITLVSTDDSVTIKGDDTNKEIDFQVSSSVGNAFGVIRLNTDGGTLLAEADTTHDLLTLVEGDNITITTTDAGDHTIEIAATAFTGAATAWTSATADSGTTATADTATDTIAFTGGTGIDTVVANDPESITIAIDSTVAQAAFTTIDVPAGTDPVATIPAETLTFAEGIAIDILGSATDTITFSFDGTIEGLAWPAGPAPNIDLDSPNGTILVGTSGASTITLDVDTSAVTTLAYKGVNTDSGNVVSVTHGSSLDVFGGTGIATAGTNRADTADGITTDEVQINLDATITAYGTASASGTPADNTAVAWGSGAAPTLTLISSDDTLEIKGDNTNKEIDLTVSSLIGTLAWTTIITDREPAVTADNVTDKLGIFGGTGVTVYGYDGPSTDTAEESTWGTPMWGEGRWGDVGTLDYLVIEIDDTEVATKAWTTATGDTGTATADTVSDTISFTGGTGIITTATDDPEDISIAIDTSAVAQNAFTTVAADSGTSATADTPTDTLTLTGGTGIDTTSANDPESITIAIDSTAVAQTAFTTIAADSGTSGTADTPTDTLTITGGTGIDTVSANDPESITIAIDSTVATEAFKTINAPAGTDPVADATADTLNLTVATGSNLTITGDSSTDTLDWDWAGVIVEKGGSEVGTRPRINFIEGANVTLTIADDSGNDEVDVTVATNGVVTAAFTAIDAPSGTDPVADSTTDTLQMLVASGSNLTITGDSSADSVSWDWDGVTVRENSGSSVGTRPRLNFIEGSNIALTIADDGIADEIDITVAATGVVTNAFTTINAPSGTDPVADSATDTLNLTVAGGSNLAITGTVGTDTVEWDWTGVSVEKEGSAIGTQPILNFIEGTGILLTIADDGSEIDVTIDTTGVVTSAFTTINAPSGTDPAADSATDTLNLAVDATSNLTITGDSSTDTVTWDWDGVTVRKNTGINLGTRPQLNFIEGSNITLTINDDATSDEMDITIATSAANYADLAFKTIAPPSGTNPEADAHDDTLNLAVDTGSNLTITGDSSTDTLTWDWAGVTARLNSGSNVGTRPRLNFIEGSTNVDITVADDSPGDEIDITIDTTGAVLPAGTDTQMLYNNGGTWGATSNAQHNGANTSFGSLGEPQTDRTVEIGQTLTAATTYGLYLKSETTNTGGSAKHHELYIGSEIDTGAGNQWDEHYSVYVADVTTTSGDHSNGIAYGIYIQDVSAATTTNWAIYNAGDKPIFSAGDFRLQSDTKQISLTPNTQTSQDSPHLTFESYKSSTLQTIDFFNNQGAFTNPGPSDFRLELQFDNTTRWWMDEDGRQSGIGVGRGPASSGDNNIEIGFGHAVSAGTTFGMSIDRTGSATANTLWGVNVHDIGGGAHTTGVIAFNVEGVTNTSSGYAKGLHIGDVTSTSGTAYAIETGVGDVYLNDNVGIKQAPNASYGLAVTGASILTTGDFTVLAGDIKMTTGDVDLGLAGRIIGTTHVNLAPTSGSGVSIDFDTKDLILKDSGSAGATEQDWIEVTVGGVTGYIRVFSTK